MPDVDPDIPGSTLVTVYEAINDTRRELFIGLSTLFMSDIESRLRARQELAHWKDADRTRVQAIEYGMPYNSAREFLARYEQAKANAGWKILSTRELDERPVERHAPSRGRAFGHGAR